MTAACGCDEFRWRRLLTRRHLIRSGVGLAALGTLVPGGRSSVFGQDGAGTPAASPMAASPVAGERVPISFSDPSPLINGSFITPLVDVYGDIEIGRRCFVAGSTIIYAHAGRHISIGNENNCQDNAYLLATAGNLLTANMVSIAHQAVIEDSTVGNFTFFGFRSRVRRAVIGDGSMVMHNTTVEDVIVPPNRITPNGARITRQEDADALPELVAANDTFKRDVQDVNLEFVTGYTRLYEEFGRAALEGASPSPVTSWNPTRIEPTLGAGVVLAELAHVVGDVRLGEGSSVGQRTSIRADEGSPIVIGRRARIQSRTTFHALKGTRVDVGENAQIGDGNVIHGPVVIGDNFVSEDDCVVFRATVEHNVAVRAGATVAGDFTLREGTIVPEGTVVTTQEEADRLPVR